MVKYIFAEFYRGLCVVSIEIRPTHTTNCTHPLNARQPWIQNWANTANFHTIFFLHFCLFFFIVAVACLLVAFAFVAQTDMPIQKQKQEQSDDYENCLLIESTVFFLLSNTKQRSDGVRTTASIDLKCHSMRALTLTHFLSQFIP